MQILTKRTTVNIGEKYFLHDHLGAWGNFEKYRKIWS